MISSLHRILSKKLEKSKKHWNMRIILTLPLLLRTLMMLMKTKLIFQIPSILESSKTALENKEILQDESNVAHDLIQQQLLERDEKELCDSSSLVLHKI